MSIFIRTDRKSNLIRAEVEGEHSGIQELHDIQVIMDYLVANPDMNLLCDRRKQTRMHDPGFSLKVAALIGTRIHEIGPRKFAWVVNKTRLYQLDRRFCPLLEHHGIEARISNDPGGALNWLSGDNFHQWNRPPDTTLGARC